MPRPRPSRRKSILTGSDRRVERAIRLLELLSSVEGTIVTADEARTYLKATDAEIDEAIALIATLADRESGARAVIFRDHDDIVLAGEGSELMPLRLSLGEGAALACVMGELHLPNDVRDRLSRALLPDGWRPDATPLVAGTVSFGAWYPALQQAIAERARIRIAYRAHGDTEARERLVDPLALEVTADAAYLRARDVLKRGERRYRLERIAAVTNLGAHTAAAAPSDSAAHAAVAESLRATAPLVELALAPGAAVPTWDGIEEMSPAPDGAGETRLKVRVAAEPWLFDHVLAAGGALRIVAPAATVDAFLAYAAELT